ncbi:MAG TPA: radical SAM protein [Nitrospirae bacterium]|nr:pyrroloquinoline quinone biosynthesis protein PqqE [bacterium BMS3Abin06]HDH12906.1 radical SAM protein [Nitrospirota bacterium]HDZ01682.1 radical SAM protein [Nitrospirota bacterium]
MINKAINKPNIVRGLYSLYNWIPYHTGMLTPYPVGSFIINISRECEMKCMMCNIWKNRRSEYKGYALDKDILSKTLSESKILKKMPYIVMTGGESFLRKDYKDILVSLLNIPHVLKITIGTSAFLTTKILSDVEHVMQNTPGGKQIALQVSLQGTEDVQDRIKGKENCFKRVEETMRGLKEIQKKYPDRLILYIYSVLQPENKDTFEKTYEFSRKHDIGYSFGIVNNMLYNKNRDDEYSKERVTDSDIERLVNVNPIYGMLRTWNKKNFTQQSTGIRCFAGYSSFFIDYDGSVSPCLPVSTLDKFRMGNIFEKDFDEIWKNAAKVRELTKKCAMDECLQGCDRAVVRMQYFLPDLISRVLTFNRYSLLRSKGMIER